MNGMLWKSTIVVWSPFDPQKLEASDLVRRGEVDDCYISKCEAKPVECPQSDPDWDGTDFFGDVTDPDEEKDT